MNILIRVDASIEIGTGHFVRQIALAQLLIDEGFTVHFLTKTTQKELLDQAMKEGIQLQTMDSEITIDQDAKKTVQYAKHQGVHWVILDGYPFVTEYQQIIKSAGLKLMCVDDIAECHFVADVVLNQNTTDSTIYSKEPYTQLLMGPEYALLRREFRLYEDKKDIRNRIEDIIITMGGSDEKNMTETILKWILNLPELSGIRCHFVLGSLNPHRDSIEAILSGSNLDGKVYTALSAQEMLNLMCKVDLAITAAGSIVWEYIKVGVPFIAMQVYENQYYVIDWIAENMSGSIIKKSHQNLFNIKFNYMLKSQNRILMKKLADDVSKSKKINDIITLL